MLVIRPARKVSLAPAVFARVRKAIAAAVLVTGAEVAVRVQHLLLVVLVLRLQVAELVTAMAMDC
jgi:hypothetical protein